MTNQRARHEEYKDAKAAAIRLLAHRARTRQYLEQRLRGKGLAAEAVEQALADLGRAGYVDDEQYARDRIDALLRQSKRGPLALTHKLVQEGVDGDLAERAVSEALRDEDLSEWALEVAVERATRLSDLEPETARRRLYGYLKRRGFSDAHCMGAVEEAIADEASD
ncbi:MAG: regulatory protein RecX [Armatimonadota bacterium]|jgi:regulatory protein